MKTPRSEGPRRLVHSVETVVLSHVAGFGTPRLPGSRRMGSRTLRRTTTSARVPCMG